MQWLAEVCVKRPVFATVLILVICVIGLFGYQKLGVDRFPKIDLPVVTIITRLPGAAPEDVETEITDKVEAAVNTISGIDELRSISSEGLSMVIVTFLLEKDPDVGSQEVRDRLNSIIPSLPRGIDLPIVNKLDPDASPIVFISLSADKDVREITEFADKRVRRLLENIPGVGQVVIVGGQKRRINVVMDPIRLRSLGLTSLDVERTIAAQNLTMPGGAVENGPEQLTLRIHGRVSRSSEIGDLVVKQQGGRPVRVSDVARVEDAGEEPVDVAERNGKPTVLLTVRKQSGSNTVEVADTVRARLADVQKILPPGYRVDIVRDDSGVIRTSVNAVKEHLAVGAVLAALVVLLFLGSLRSTLISAIAIPTSIIGTFAIMWQQGFTLNTITLLALALAVGIVIDDAIVVLENIFRFVEEKGEHPMEAAVGATREIGLAVLATTLSLIAVFLPVAFMAGIPGRFLKQFGLTMAFAIGVSLLVSFSLTPMLASRWLAPHDPERGEEKPFLERVVDVFYRPIERAYLAVLRFSMRHRWVIVVACVLTLGSCVPLGAIAKKGFLPVNDEAQFQVSVRAPEGTSLPQTRIIAERFAREIRDFKEVEQTILTVGDDEAHTPNLASIFVRLVPPEKRARTQDQMKEVVREEVIGPRNKDGKLRITVGDIAMFGGSGFSTAKVQYAVSGPDLAVLERVSNDVTNKLKQVRGAVDVDSSLISGKPELGVYVNRARAADLGVQVADIAGALRLLVGGDKVGTYEEHGEQYDVYARAEAKYRANPEGLRLLTVPSRTLGQVELSDVVDLRRGAGPAAINRLNRQRQVMLFANPAPGYGESQISSAMKKIIDEQKLPREYVAASTGMTRETGRTAVNFGLAFALSFIFMYLVLAAQFESWLHPVTILISLPLTIPFAILSVVLFRQQLDIYSALGMLVLFGVVKKNAILQIDHTNGLRRSGVPRYEAILQANRDRLRPILMTTFAFVAGMIPLVLSRGVGAGFNRATAGVVVGGQLLSLLLTLLAAPVFYSLFDDAAVKLRKLFRMKPSTEFATETAEPGAV